MSFSPHLRRGNHDPNRTAPWRVARQMTECASDLIQTRSLASACQYPGVATRVCSYHASYAVRPLSSNRIMHIGAQANREALRLAIRDKSSDLHVYHEIFLDNALRDLGLSALEAMATGRPLLATSVSAFDRFQGHRRNSLAVLRQVALHLASRPQRPAVVQALTWANRNGSSGKAARVVSYIRRSERCNGVLLVVPLADSAALAAQLPVFLANDDLRRRLVAQAEPDARAQFDILRTAGELMAVYREAIGETAQQPIGTP